MLRRMVGYLIEIEQKRFLFQDIRGLVGYGYAGETAGGRGYVSARPSRLSSNGRATTLARNAH